MDSSGAESKPLSFQVGYARPLTRVENLTAWWSFDDVQNGNFVTDYMNGFEGQFYSGDSGTSNVTFDSVNAKFGSVCVSQRMLGLRQWVTSSLGIGGSNARTISFWMAAESGQTVNQVHMVVGIDTAPMAHRLWD